MRRCRRSARFQTSRHAARSSPAVTREGPGHDARDERGLGVAGFACRVVQPTRHATTVSWWSPRTPWSSAIRLAVRFAPRPATGAVASQRVAGLLGALADLVQVGIGRHRGQLAHGLARPLPRPAASARTDRRARRSRTRSSGVGAAPATTKRSSSVVYRCERIASSNTSRIAIAPRAQPVDQHGGARRLVGGSSSALSTSRSSRTSASRTRPSCSPSQRSSARSDSLHSESSTGRNVRRSERSRRVATRAWWTPSRSSPRRTAASLSTSLAVDLVIAAPTTSASVGHAAERTRRDDVGRRQGRLTERPGDLRHRPPASGAGLLEPCDQSAGNRRNPSPRAARSRPRGSSVGSGRRPTR